jgi:hypothetical protein
LLSEDWRLYFESCSGANAGILGKWDALDGLMRYLGVLLCSMELCRFSGGSFGMLQILKGIFWNVADSQGDILECFWHIPSNMDLNDV